MTPGAGAGRSGVGNRRWWLCTALLLAGCAGKTTSMPEIMPEMPPENGQCGIVQDTCRLGTPSGTGDTTPPYGWMCLGLRGGTNDSCSVPTARIEEDEVFAGQNALEEKVKAAGPLRGLLTIGDFTVDHPNCDPVWCHAHLMKRYALEMGIPEENLHVTPLVGLHQLFGGDYNPTVPKETLVFSFPVRWAGDVLDVELDILKRHDFLVVTSAGNTENNNRDLWEPSHPWWLGRRWENAMKAFATGKVILAKYAKRGDDGTIVPLDENVKCGEAKEFCYSILTPVPRWCMDGTCHNQDLGTSGASVNLGALTFYLFQLWDTPQEVVGVLNTCAEDVGEPGIDEEFGRGIVSVVCDTVRNRERSAVSSSLNVFNASPVLTQMAGGGESRQLVPQSLAATSRSLPVAAWFRPFYAVRGHDLETVTGHLGGQFSLRGTDLFVSGGADYSPLGVRSSLLYSGRTPFMEFGSRRTLFARNGHRIALLGAYGYSSGNDLSAHVGHLGARYEQALGAGLLALHVGYRQVRGHVGIPGYREAGAEPVPFVSGDPEVRLSFSVGR